jgi:polar amino acid transport system substrate-binding protein
MPVASSVLSAFAPSGKLRASINLGNPILAHSDAAGYAGGVSVDLAGAFAQRLGVALELVTFETAGKAVEAVAGELADIGFFAIDPVRGAEIAFTAPYVLIEGCYLVREDSPIAANEEVDVAAHRVVVGAASAYDLYLTRALQQAQIVRAPSSPAVIETFLAQRAEVAAGVKQQLEADARRLGGLRLLDGRFMVIRQAMGVPKSRGPEAAAFLHDFVEEMKRDGFVQAALQRHRVAGASIAPAEADGVGGA